MDQSVVSREVQEIAESLYQATIEYKIKLDWRNSMATKLAGMKCKLFVGSAKEKGKILLANEVQPSAEALRR
ncbi:hypothetical protein P7H21_23650 [Paenibacillus larvae]|nr:hypothetical protein [Paenibacillus larvae]MDT2306343.1 hypothetical protein [Paenibacillus larvae]